MPSRAAAVFTSSSVRARCADALAYFPCASSNEPRACWTGGVEAVPLDAVENVALFDEAAPSLEQDVLQEAGDPRADLDPLHCFHAADEFRRLGDWPEARPPGVPTGMAAGCCPLTGGKNEATRQTRTETYSLERT